MQKKCGAKDLSQLINWAIAVFHEAIVIHEQGNRIASCEKNGICHELVMQSLGLARTFNEAKSVIDTTLATVEADALLKRLGQKPSGRE
jgi:hypothetical protein